MSGPFDLSSLVNQHAKILQGIQDQASSSRIGEDFYNLEGATEIVHPETGETYGEFVEAREGSIGYRFGFSNKPHVQKFYEKAVDTSGFGATGPTYAEQLQTQLQQYNFIIQQCEDRGKLSAAEAKICADARREYEALKNVISSPSFTEQDIYGVDFGESGVDELGEKGAAIDLVGGDLEIEADVLAQRQPKNIAERALVIRNAVQCWLLYNMEAFADFHKISVDVDADSFISEPGFQSRHLRNQPDHRQRILLVNEETDGATLPSKFHARKGTKAFNLIQPHEYAQLMPMMRIFKTYYDNTSGDKQVIEMEFSNDTTLDGIAKQLTLDQPPLQIGGRPPPYKIFTRGSEVGVKSFEWTNIGTDPFTATRDIEATLVLTAQSFASLAKVRFGDVIGGGRKDYRYLDLIVQPDCEDNYSANCYEIRIDVGYADIQDQKGFEMSEDLKKNIPAQKDILYLTLTDHSLNINDDGTVDLTVNYRGRLEGIMKSRKMNILLPAGGYLANELRFEVDGEPGGKMYNIDLVEDIVKKLRNKKNRSTRDDSRIKNFETALANVNVRFKQVIHSYIMDRLYSQNKVFEYEIPKEEIALFKSFQADLEGKAVNIPKTTSLKDIAGGVTHLGRGDGIIKTGLLGQNETFTGVSLGQDQDELDGNVEKGLEENNRRTLLQPAKIRFFYLGDILGLVLDHVTGDNTVTGDLVIKSLLGGFFERATQITAQSGQASAFATKTGYTNAQTLKNAKQVQKAFENFRMILGNLDLDKKINLAHIPISMDAFNTFFINTVLSKERTNYPFFDFVDDLLVEFVMDPITTACFGGLFNIDFIPKVQNYSVPNLIDTKYMVDEKAVGGLPSPYKSLKLDEVNEKNPLFKFETASELIKNIYEYVVITGEINNFDDLHGNEEEDMNNGIMHLHFANALGLVKKIDFSKTDQEYLPEARFAEEGNFIFNQLANVYDIKIDMIGNNLFKPGQHLYVNTEAIGAGKTSELSVDNDGNVLHRSWANLMGLGGYHLVTEVAHYIGPDGYNTLVKARWVSAGRSKSATVPTPTGPPSGTQVLSPAGPGVNLS